MVTLPEEAAEDGALVRAGAKETPIQDVAALGRFALNHPGDPKAGEELFVQSKLLACGRCHAAAVQSPESPGPDLSDLGARSDKARIIQSLVDPPPPLANAHRAVTGQLRSISAVQFADLISFLQELKADPATAQRPRSR